MDIVTTIVGNIVGLIFEPVRQEIGYSFSYKSNVDKLRAEVQTLREVWTDKQRIVDDHKRNNRDIAAAVEGWLNRVKVTISKANELINKDDEGRGEVRCLKQPFPNLCVRRKLSKDAEEMAQKVSEITAEGRSHQIVSFTVPPQMIDSSSARGYEALESRESILNEIKEALKDPNINMIGVYGMGGVGKTTLMEELACQAKTERLFEVVLMVTPITNTPDFRRIQGQLADGLGLELKKETEEGRAGELRGSISNGESILIILDDIWDELKLGELGIPYCADRKGCKVVLTSRDRDVLRKKMKIKTCFPLEVFSDGESWNLFEKIVGDVVKHPSINSIAVDVVKCCAGLPLLIDIVATYLREELDIPVWKDTLTRLQSNSGNYRDKVNCSLKSSYERLEGEEHKSLFSLIGSFGQVGIGIHTEELLQACWGLRIYKDVSTLAQARNRQHTLIKDLRASSLLHDGETKWVRMHDLVYDMAKLIASETRCTYTGKRLTKINEWPRDDQLQNYHHIILHDYCTSELPEKLGCPKLEILLLHFTGINYLEIPDNFFSEMKEVKVLHLSGMKLTNPSPLSHRCLAGLRSLNLSKSELEDISIIGELRSLEILILKRAKKLVKLPEKIGDLTSLRVLNVSECRCLTFIPENLLSRLECLEELYMEVCPIKWKVEGSNDNIASLGDLRNLDNLTDLHLMIEDGSTLPEDLHNFENLERYNISIGRWSSELGPNFSRVLTLSGSSILTLFSNAGVEVLLIGVEGLVLAEWEGVIEGDFMKLKCLVLPKLHYLRLDGVHMKLAPFTLLAKKVSNMPNLETLELSRIETCKIWEDNLDAHSHVRNLRTLKVTKCSRLTILFPSSVARALAELKHLEIDNCRGLKTIFVQDDISIEEVILPNLETLLISELDELELLWPSHLAPNSYCKLNKMEVSSCPKLLNVFPSYVLNNLLNLEKLHVWYCDELRVIIEIQEQSPVATNQQEIVASENDAGDAPSEITFMKLEKLELGDLPMLESFCRGNYSFNFPSLKEVRVGDGDLNATMRSIFSGKISEEGSTKLGLRRRIAVAWKVNRAAQMFLLAREDYPTWDYSTQRYRFRDDVF